MPPPSPPENAGAEEARGTASAQVKTETAGEDGAFINVKVKSQIAADVFFRIKRDVRLRRLMDLYCGKHSLDPKAVLFLDPEGGHIRPAQTPDDVGLKDGEIDILLRQDGGGCSAREPAGRTSA